MRKMTIPNPAAGQKFGRLTVIESFSKKPIKVRVICDCGTEKVVTKHNLIYGCVVSCGCFKKENPPNLKHGHSRRSGASIEYISWQVMIQRCTNLNHERFPEYGGAGIKVCERWLNSFEYFLQDMGPRRSRQNTIDRIDGTKGYEPGNCRWATHKEQQRNLKSNRLFEFEGRIQCVTAWCEERKLPAPTIFKRLEAGWSIERALTEPIQKKYGRKKK